MKQLPPRLNQELQEAKSKGFVYDLFLNEDGDFVTSSDEVVSPKIIEIIQCHHCSATIYLVAGEKACGTWVYHWESPSN